MDYNLYTTDEEIADVSKGRPHVVILGAGASVAAFPHGDRNGAKLPVMANFIEILGLKDMLKAAGVQLRGRNFENIYSSICNTRKYAKLAKQLESRVADYFSRLQLPDGPTIYDYLVLSLRSKDLIATFNWDPFLWLAYKRNHSHADLPRIAFLHGCSIVGYCQKDNWAGLLGRHCRRCGKKYRKTRLLFPVENKDYVSDPFIVRQWETLQVFLKEAFLLTIFGYGAPATDSAAVDLMKKAWGTSQRRSMEEIEIIDILNDDELENRWKAFIHSHHYITSGSLFGKDSILFNHPRRSCEAMFQSLINARDREGNCIKQFPAMKEVLNWFKPLIDVERTIR